MHDATVHLDPPTLASVRAGGFNFLQVLRRAAHGAGLRLGWRGEEDAPAPLSLWHMQGPRLAGALIFRRTYHYPFWHIEAEPERWRWPVAISPFNAGTVPVQPARAFTRRLAARVLPGPQPTRQGPVLVPLQGKLSRARSFQTMSPLDMVEAVGRSGLRADITLHPKEVYSRGELRALDRIVAGHPGLQLAQGTAALLRDAAAVVTQNSAVAFDGFILNKPAVLFAQIDFHHIALNVSEMGAEAALAQVTRHWPPTPRYVAWFLGQAIDAMAPDADAQVLAALRRGGWPV